jgi:tetratricopeptide (TPR) repeat protein
MRSLADAAAAHRAALEVYTRDALPQQWAAAQSNLGAALVRLGERQAGAEAMRSLADAAAAHRAALEIRTRDALPQQWATTQKNLAIVLESLGRRQGGDEGARRLGEALESRRQLLDAAEAPARADRNDIQAQRDLSAASYRFGMVAEKLGKFDLARSTYERMLGVDESIGRARPTDADARKEIATDCGMLSDICQRLGDWSAAVDYAQKAIEHAQAAQGLAAKEGRSLALDVSAFYRKLGNAHLGAGRPGEALRSYEDSAKTDPKSPVTLNDLAWLLATSWDESVRDGKRSVELATKACELTEFKQPFYFDTLAAACAEVGRFADAVAWQKKALEHPERFSEKDVKAMPERLKLYESGKPFHEPRPGR